MSEDVRDVRSSPGPESRHQKLQCTQTGSAEVHQTRHSGGGEPVCLPLVRQHTHICLLTCSLTHPTPTHTHTHTHTHTLLQYCWCSCKKMTPALKRFTLHRLPNILTIQLKRLLTHLPPPLHTHTHTHTPFLVYTGLITTVCLGARSTSL